MCTYRIALDDGLVMQAENTFQIKESFQTWLQHITPCEKHGFVINFAKSKDKRYEI